MQRLLERDVAEIAQSGAAPGFVDQVLGARRLAPAGEHVRDHLGNGADN
jgi:hypothetical protein